MSDTRKLPVFASLGEVLSGVTRHYFQLLMVAWPAALLILICVFISGWQYYESGALAAYVADNGKPDFAALMAAQAKLSAPESQAIDWASQLTLIFASAVAAVRWHRFVLLGEGANGVGGVQLLRKEDARYIWTTIKLAAIFVTGALVWALLAAALLRAGLPESLSIVGYVFIFVSFVWFYVLLVRLMLALPDASLGLGGRVRYVFKQSEGNSWRIVGFLFLLALVIAFSATLLAFVFMAVAGALGLSLTTSPATLTVAAIFYLGLYLYFLMAQITMLSVAYREIIGLPQPPAIPA